MDANMKDVEIKNFEWVEDQILSFELLPNDELIRTADKIRAAKGYTDIVCDNTNDVWYNFYLDVDVVAQTITLWFECNNGEKDDYANYDIWLTENEIHEFIWKAFRQFAKEMDSEVDFT